MAAQSGQGPPVLYLNAGDTYTGTAWFTIYKWKIAAEFINALQPDAVVSTFTTSSSFCLVFCSLAVRCLCICVAIVEDEDNT